MKSDGIKRSVRASRHDRSAGDAPNLGRVARMPGTGIPKQKRRRRSQRGEAGWRSASDRPKSSARWTILFAAMVVFSLGVALWMWMSPKLATEGRLSATAPMENEAEVGVSAHFPSPSEQDAVALVKRAVAVRDPATVARSFRPGSASPAEIVGFLEGMDAVDGRIRSYEWMSSVDANRLAVEGVVVNFENTDGLRNRLALLTPDASGVWKVDFDAFARTVRPSWKEILETRPETALVRVQIIKDSYFNGPFRDEGQWICLGMASPDTEEMLFGYCRAGSPQAAAIEWMFSKENAKLCRATLELHRVEGAEHRQYEISKVLAQDWIVADVPFEEGFR
jgi:hypothetical protein